MNDFDPQSRKVIPWRSRGEVKRQGANGQKPAKKPSKKLKTQGGVRFWHYLQLLLFLAILAYAMQVCRA